jgi:hypothetical protein
MTTRTIDEVLDRLHAIGASVPAGDGVGAFNTVYDLTTQAVRDRLGAGFFDDDVFVERLDVVFADRYLAAVDAAAGGQEVDAAWRPLFQRRADHRVRPVQFVVAGMNAHINHDLAIAVVDTCAAAHIRPTEGSIPADYDRVNVILEEIEARVRAAMLDDLERELGRPVEPLVHLVGSWSIHQARDAAWVRAQVLWELRGLPRLYRRTIEVSASATGMTSRHLLTPVLPG